MSFPFKPSTNKSGRLTRQATVVSHAGGNSHDPVISSPIQDSYLHILNPKSTLLLRAELPKPMSRLPEIRLEGGVGGNGNKSLISTMKPQKSCESYDSTVSGMSWSSSQSTAAIESSAGCFNSASMSRNLSFGSYEDDDDQPQKPLSRIPSNPGGMQKSQYSPKGDGNPQRYKGIFATGQEEHQEETLDDPRIPKSPEDLADVFLDTVFDEHKCDVSVISAIMCVKFDRKPLKEM